MPPKIFIIGLKLKPCIRKISLVVKVREAILKEHQLHLHNKLQSKILLKDDQGKTQKVVMRAQDSLCEAQQTMLKLINCKLIAMRVDQLHN